VFGARVDAAALDLAARARDVTLGEPLSDRELVVLRELAGPLSQREIGEQLYVSDNTVKSHTRSIFRKLGVSAREDAVARARELGLL
jgi:LuxR family maltose regulon positive regulatory protein